MYKPELYIASYAIFVRRKSMYLRTCGCFKSAWVCKSQIHNSQIRKSQIRLGLQIENPQSAMFAESNKLFKSANLRFAEPICGPHRPPLEFVVSYNPGNSHHEDIIVICQFRENYVRWRICPSFYMYKSNRR